MVEQIQSTDNRSAVISRGSRMLWVWSVSLRTNDWQQRNNPYGWVVNYSHIHIDQPEFTLIMEIIARSATSAFIETIEKIQNYRHANPSRNGDVIRLGEPLLVHYLNSRDMVIENPVRNCNPFFHLMEAAWMLCGRKDVASLSYFNSHIKNYSDNGEDFHGAYGYRWRHHFMVPHLREAMVNAEKNDNRGFLHSEIDQLERSITFLKTDIHSRRVVISMWDPTVDIPQQLRQSCKDLPCNTQIYIQLNSTGNALDIHVMNRSNDLIWGMLGANVVHFSFLHQWLAARLDIPVGTYYHYTANGHIYTDTYPDHVLNDMINQQPEDTLRGVNFQPLFNGPTDASLFIESFLAIFATYDNRGSWDFLSDPENIANIVGHYRYQSPIIKYLYAPMMCSWWLYKNKKHHQAYLIANDMINAYWDWSESCAAWMKRAEERYKSKNPYAAQ